MCRDTQQDDVEDNVRVLLLAFSLTVIAATQVFAAPPADTLARVKETGKLVIGFREDARPFSFRDEGGNPAGFSVDLCRRIAAEVKAAVGRDVDVTFVPVTAGNRIAMVQKGEVDIECASSTYTLERRKKVDFTLETFVTGAEMLVRVGSNIKDLPDVAGKKVGVLKGTTTEVGLKSALKAHAINAEVMTFTDHKEGLRALEGGKIDAYFGDRILLVGLARDAKDPQELQLSGKFYSYEPYAFMVRRGDDNLRLVADTALATLYRSGQVWKIYEKYFGGAQPSGLLVALYILQAIPVR